MYLIKGNTSHTHIHTHIYICFSVCVIIGLFWWMNFSVRLDSKIRNTGFFWSVIKKIFNVTFEKVKKNWIISCDVFNICWNYPFYDCPKVLIDSVRNYLLARPFPQTVLSQLVIPNKFHLIEVEFCCDVMVKAMTSGIVVSKRVQTQVTPFTFGQIPLGKVWTPLSSHLLVK